MPNGQVQVLKARAALVPMKRPFWSISGHPWAFTALGGPSKAHPWPIHRPFPLPPFPPSPPERLSVLFLPPRFFCPHFAQSRRASIVAASQLGNHVNTRCTSPLSLYILSPSPPGKTHSKPHNGGRITSGYARLHVRKCTSQPPDYRGIAGSFLFSCPYMAPALTALFTSHFTI